MPKKVLVITYYWPPAGGVVVQRWVKFSKYLNEHGWQPVIYTVSNGHYPLTDNTFQKDVPEDLIVIKKPIWEPYSIYKLFSREAKATLNPLYENKSSDGASLIKRISVWVRSNFFIPDARKFWIRPSIKFLSGYLKENPIDAIVSTGPPHSMHLIALGLKKRLQLPWLADFRDPWTTIDYYQKLLLMPSADKKHHQLEASVLNSADAVTVVARGMKQEFELKRKGQITLIPNGFDEDDFKYTDIELSKDFSLVHVGTFYERLNPVVLWRALGELNQESHPLTKKLKIRLVGRTDQDVIQSINDFGLKEYLELIPFQPHEQALLEMRKAQVLFLSIYEKTPWVLTGKLFEYFASQRPILCIGPLDGDAALAIQEAQAGQTFSYEDVKGIKENLVSLYHQFESDQLRVNSSANKLFSHRQLAFRISEILNEISSSTN